MKTGTVLAGAVFVGCVALAVGRSVQVPQRKAPVPVPAVRVADERYKVPVETSSARTRGPHDAPVTIVELGDFQCPFTARALPGLRQVEDAYPGDVRVIFQHYPLESHEHASLAAEWAEAAAEQGKFWAMHDRLFAGQGALDVSSLESYAGEVGLDIDRARAFVAEGRGRAAIAEGHALGVRLGVTGTPAFFINGVKVSGLLPVASFQQIVQRELELAREMKVPRDAVYGELMKTAREAAAASARPPEVVRQNVQLVPGAPRKGGRDALVTIVEFSDFECPYCGAATPALDQLLKEYGEDLAIEFRHVPLPFHPRALPCARAAVAAHRQGKFWAYHDQLFANQKALQDSDLEKYAANLHLDLARFRRDLTDPVNEASIQRDREDANKYAVRGTPTMFVDGLAVRGAQPIGAYKAIIDRELATARALLENGVKRSEVYKTILQREAGRAVDMAPERR